jgi:hypothetical protein
MVPSITNWRHACLSFLRAYLFRHYERDLKTLGVDIRPRMYVTYLETALVPIVLVQMCREVARPMLGFGVCWIPDPRSINVPHFNPAEPAFLNDSHPVMLPQNLVCTNFVQNLWMAMSTFIRDWDQAKSIDLDGLAPAPLMVHQVIHYLSCFEAKETDDSSTDTTTNASVINLSTMSEYEKEMGLPPCYISKTYPATKRYAKIITSESTRKEIFRAYRVPTFESQFDLRMHSYAPLRTFRLDFYQ